jgi:hypothetical protein
MPENCSGFSIKDQPLGHTIAQYLRGAAEYIPQAFSITSLLEAAEG